MPVVQMMSVSLDISISVSFYPSIFWVLGQQLIRCVQYELSSEFLMHPSLQDEVSPKIYYTILSLLASIRWFTALGFAFLVFGFFILLVNCTHGSVFCSLKYASFPISAPHPTRLFPRLTEFLSSFLRSAIKVKLFANRNCQV